MERSDVLQRLEEYRREVTFLVEYHPEVPPEDKLRRMLDFLRNCSDYLLFCIKKLSSRDCEDPYLTTSIINIYNAFQDHTLMYMSDAFHEQLRLKKELTDVREGVNYGRMNVLKVIRNGNWYFLKLLILYGVIGPRETLTYFVQQTRRDVLQRFLGRVALKREQWTNVQNHAKCISDRLSVSDVGYPDTPDRRAKTSRKCTVLKALVTEIGGWGMSQSGSVLKCLSYYFQVIPDPFVTVREIEDLIEIPETPCQSSQFLFDRDGFRDVMIEYREVFPECDVLQPRSLQHLCRCAARKHLCNYGFLPDVVSRLRIPKAIKDYLIVIRPES